MSLLTDNMVEVLDLFLTERIHIIGLFFLFLARTGFRNPNIFSVGGDQRSKRGERGGVRRGVDERVLRALLPRDRVRGTVVVFQGA